MDFPTALHYQISVSKPPNAFRGIYQISSGVLSNFGVKTPCFSLGSITVKSHIVSPKIRVLVFAAMLLGW